MLPDRRSRRDDHVSWTEGKIKICMFIQRSDDQKSLKNLYGATIALNSEDHEVERIECTNL